MTDVTKDRLPPCNSQAMSQVNTNVLWSKRNSLSDKSLHQLGALSMSVPEPSGHLLLTLLMRLLVNRCKLSIESSCVIRHLFTVCGLCTKNGAIYLPFPVARFGVFCIHCVVLNGSIKKRCQPLTLRVCVCMWHVVSVIQ